MSNWTAWKASDLLLPELVSSFESGSDAYQKYLEFAKATIEAAQLAKNALSPELPNVLQAAIQAIVDVVEGILQTGKIHVLFIPIGKIYSARINPGLPSTLRDVAEYFGVDEETIAAPTYAARAYGMALTGNQGNAGFLQTFITSLMDERDPNRPQYTHPTDAVAMQVILAGANSFTDAVTAASALNRIFSIESDRDLAARQIPIPQSLRAKVIGVPTDTRIGVRLDWETPPPKFSSRYFPSSYIQVKRTAIIRSIDPRIMSKTSVLDLFPTQTLKKGLISTDKDASHEVIGIVSGATTTWIDNDELDANTTYYYTLAWELEIAESGKLSLLPFDKLSSAVKTQARTTTPTQTGTPPNWQSQGAPLDAIPGLSQKVKILLERLKTQTKRASGTKNLLSAALDNLTTNLNRQIKQIDNLVQQLSLLNSAFNVPMPQLYTTSITGLGGNAKLISELAARLFDPNDPNRPMFGPNAYTMGICIVAGGPRKPDLSAITDLWNSLFEDPRPSNPLYDVLTNIETAVATAENYIFGPDMQAYPYNPDGTIQTPDGPVDPADIDPITGLPIPPDLPVIGPDGSPIATMDPDNPVAGDPNACSS